MTTMAMMKRKLRVPSEGPFVGDPPLEVGAGTTGLVWRAHGTSTSAQAIATSVTAPTEIAGLAKADAFACALEPGYLYAITLDTEVHQQTVTAHGDFIPVWATRNASTGVWSAWGRLSGSSSEHFVTMDAGATELETQHAVDANYDIVVTTISDAIAFGVYGPNATLLDLLPGFCFARIEQYSA